MLEEFAEGLSWWPGRVAGGGGGGGGGMLYFAWGICSFFAGGVKNYQPPSHPVTDVTGFPASRVLASFCFEAVCWEQGRFFGS